MKLRTIAYSIKEGFKSLWRNRMMSIASITSVAATLIILGIIFIMVVNVNNLAIGAKEQFDTVQVFIEKDVQPDRLKEIGEEIRNIDGVLHIEYETKNEALEKQKEQWGKNAYLLEGLETNPFPNSYIVTLNDIQYADYVVDSINKVEDIEEINYYQDVIVKILNANKYIRNIGLGLIIILLVISIFIINNTIKLAVNARSREINIMKYIGATSWFVRWPFVMEGTFLGVIGALIASLIIFVFYNYTFNLLQSEFYVIIAAYIVDVKLMMRNIIEMFLVLGAGIGSLGSLMSVHKHLEV